MNKRQKLDYFDNPALSQSFLKVFPYNRKIDKNSAHILLGSSSDLILTEPDNFLKQFHISKSTLKDGPVKDLFNTLDLQGSLDSNKDYIYDYLMSIGFKGFGRLNKEGKPRDTWWSKVKSGETYYNDSTTGKFVLTQQDYEKTKKCVELFHHPWLKWMYRQQINYQCEIFFNFMDEKCKAKLDLDIIMNEDIPELGLFKKERVIIDLKTGSQYSPERLDLYMKDRNCYFQAAWYLLAKSKVSKVPVKKFFIVYVNPNYNFPSFHLMSKEELKVGAYGGNYHKHTRSVHTTSDLYPDLKGFIPQMNLYKEYQKLGDTFTPPRLIKSKGLI